MELFSEQRVILQMSTRHPIAAATVATADTIVLDNLQELL